jgi:hypothetical protein
MTAFTRGMPAMTALGYTFLREKIGWSPAREPE